MTAISLRNARMPRAQGPLFPLRLILSAFAPKASLSPAELKQEIVRRFKDGVYHSPGRPGIAYMLSPVARLYGGPGSRETVAMNMPHYMFFVPNLTAQDIGAGPVMGPIPTSSIRGPWLT